MRPTIPPRSPFSAPFSQSAKETGLRIRNIFQWRRKRPPLLAFAVICLTVVCSGSLVSCQKSNHQATTPSLQPTVTVSPTASPTASLIASLIASPAPSKDPIQSPIPDLNAFFNMGSGNVSWEEVLESGARFKGSVSSNPQELNMDYSILNGTFTHTLELSAGDMLHVELSVDTGTLGVVIQLEGESPIYQNDNLETSQFDLQISQSGSYQVTITAMNTKGSLRVQA